MCNWREDRKIDINNFEIHKEELIKNADPEIIKNAKKCDMSTEEYLRCWVYSGLTPDVRVAEPGEKIIEFPKI